MRRLGLLFLCLLQFSCTSQVMEKINGVSFVASRNKALQTHVDEVMRINANHAAVMPFGFIRDIHSPEIIFDTDRQWFGETKQGAKQYIEMLHKNNIEVMLKPQIWIWRGEFTGTLIMKSEEDWKTLEESYDKFMLTYARVAQETNVAVLCIGTELEKFVINRPEYWKGLINKIRAIYKGKLTYAANWDEYKRTPFWEALDYIGIDAYFPLSESKTPSVEELKAGWKPWKEKIALLAKKVGKPVLFTEFGYRSMDYTAKKPWLVDENEERVNLNAQANAKRAIFEEFWKEDWFAGGYVWKWFIDHKRVGGAQDNRFTPQNKPAQEIIKKYYSSY
ncbi:glycoside hydrolase family 113 [Poritiphilus flavus]|uniref:Glycoside hydrolase n=1 Tax=Poritiphilus flavus TaxID=2697053 RepID=A0A6L9EDI4_9FLAO|nr:glycoside hydrolase [Poritiphilus flavus]NAS12785.1 glycoside hydrolase [Poritiphilus flavus]